MGCEFSRKDSKNIEELRIQSAEAQLGFAAIDCSEFDMSFSRYSIGGYLNSNQLRASMDGLGITGSSLEEPPFSVYFNCFSEGDKGYSLKKLVCIGILLGKGTPVRKGELLLQNYDRDSSGEIDLDEFRTMINDMVQVSVDAAIEMTKYSDDSLSTLLTTYLRKLKRSEKMLYIYVHFIMSMGKEDVGITPDNFLNTFKDPKMQKMCTSHGIRELALELYEEQQVNE
jgi:hypothetical protein